MKNKKVIRPVAVILGTLCLTGLTGNFNVVVAAVKQPEFNWQAAPTEEMRASLTLRDAILRAFARNPQIAEAAAQIRVGGGNLDAAKSAWYPQVSLQGAGGKSRQTYASGDQSSNGSAGIQLSQLLWDFGKTTAVSVSRSIFRTLTGFHFTAR